MGPIIKDWDCNAAWQVWRHASRSDFPISVFLSSPWKVLVSVSQAWLVPVNSTPFLTSQVGSCGRGTDSKQQLHWSSNCRSSAPSSGGDGLALPGEVELLSRPPQTGVSAQLCCKTNILWLTGHSSGRWPSLRRPQCHSEWWLACHQAHLLHSSCWTWHYLILATFSGLILILANKNQLSA